MAKKQMAVLEVRMPFAEGKKWGVRINTVRVEVLAIVKTHAMVRRPGCMPFVAMAKYLTPEQ